MNIETLCAAVKKSLPILSGARVGKEIDHSYVEKFQRDIANNLNDSKNGYTWGIEQKAKGRSEKDSIDILGQAKNMPNWILEIDATRSDQVSQKLLSRLTLWGLDKPIQYVAILYPDTRNGKSACEKYLRYGDAILRKINSKSSAIGIFVNPLDNSIEILQFRKSNHFKVNGIECKSMNDAAGKALKLYLEKHNVSYAQMKNNWGKYVNNERGASRYKDLGIQTNDAETVFSFTQFRQYGLCSYWNEFERLCKQNGISVTRMRRMYSDNEGGKVIHTN